MIIMKTIPFASICFFSKASNVNGPVFRIATEDTRKSLKQVDGERRNPPETKKGGRERQTESQKSALTAPLSFSSVREVTLTASPNRHLPPARLPGGLPC